MGLIFFFVYFLVSITNFFSPEDVKNTPLEVLFLDNNMNSTTNSLCLHRPNRSKYSCILDISLDRWAPLLPIPRNYSERCHWLLAMAKSQLMPAKDAHPTWRGKLLAYWQRAQNQPSVPPKVKEHSMQVSTAYSETSDKGDYLLH